MTTSEPAAATDHVVRPMRWWDIERVNALEVHAFPETPWSVETFWSELAGVPVTRCYLVAQADEQVVGYAGLMAIGAEADVQTLAVDEENRGQGLGSQLLNGLMSEAGRRGCSRITLEVSAAAEPAMRLYRRHGFEVIARRSNYYGPGADALIMRSRLATAAEPEGSLS